MSPEVGEEKRPIGFAVPIELEGKPRFVAQFDEHGELVPAIESTSTQDIAAITAQPEITAKDEPKSEIEKTKEIPAVEAETVKFTEEDVETLHKAGMNILPVVEVSQETPRKLSAAERTNAKRAAKAETKANGEKRDRKLPKKVGVGALILAVGAAGFFGRDLLDRDGESPKVFAAASPSPEAANSKEYNENFAEDIRKLMPEIKPSEIAIADEVDFKKNPESDRGTGTFGEDTLDSQAEISQFLSSNDERSKAARQYVTQALKDRPEELKRALSGEGYTPVQFKIPVVIEGNTMYVNGEVVDISNPRVRESGDIIWLFVDKDGHIVDDASLRADCRNPDIDIIKPKRPQPLPGPFDQPGSGGEPEEGMDPENDSDNDGYGPGDTKPTPPPAPSPSPTPTSTNETNPSPKPSETATAEPSATPSGEPSPPED